MKSQKGFTLTELLIVIVIIVAVFLLLPYLLMWAWNNSFAPILHVGEIQTWLQAFCMELVGTMLTGGLFRSRNSKD